jgi:hypothetical protein
MTEESNRDPLKRAEAALAALPLREPDWDGLANRIEGAVGAQPPENTALFEAPFPASADDSDGPLLSVKPAGDDEVDEGWSDAPEAGPSIEARSIPALGSGPPAAAFREEPEEIEAMSDPSAADGAPNPPAEGVSLADLARATLAKRGAGDKANIARQSLRVASKARAEGERAAERAQAAQSIAPPSMAQLSVAPPQRTETLKGAWIGVGIAGIGLAAAFALVLTRPDQQAPIVVMQRAPEAPRAEAPPVAKATTPEAPRTPEPAREAALDPTSLPAVPRETVARGEVKATEAAPKPAPAAAPAPAGAGKVAAEKVVLDDDPKAAAKVAPSAAPRPADSKLRPADTSSGDMTDRPSAGAAQAAVGAVLGAARSCVSGHPRPSSAQIVFGSDGQVQSVAVSGPAAGTPAASCIETALKKARVQPFAASSFSLGVTVRPP